METKRCPRCETSLALDRFGWRDVAHTKRQSYCKSCMRTSWTDWYKNDHNRKHHLALVAERRRNRLARHQSLLKEMKALPCADCGRRYPPYVMDFDHLGEENKSGLVSSIAWTLGTETLLAEIEKYELVCANCHRERTQRRLREAKQGLPKP